MLDLHQPALISTFLFALVLGAFWPALSCGFINLDDPANVYESPQVIRGLSWEGVRYAFTQPVVDHWAPLTTFSHMLDCQIFGLQPWGHHLSNVLLHGLSTVLLFLVLRRMTGAIWRSAFVAALWAVHPLRVESVVWVTERKDVLSGIFLMLTLGAYVHYVRHPSSWRYVALALLFSLGLMSKSMLVTLPFALLLLDYWPLGRWTKSNLAWSLLREKTPLLALSLAISIAQVCAASQSFEAMSLSVRLENALVSYGMYLWKLVWPAKLAVYYPHPGSWPLVLPGLAAILIACVSFTVFAVRRSQGYLLVGWLWYLGSLVPVIGLLQIGGIAMADRYTYLPGIGILVMLVLGGYHCLGYMAIPIVARGLATVAIVFFASVVTIDYASKWTNSETLYRHALSVTRDNWLAHKALAGVLVKKTLPGEELLLHCKLALKSNPNCAEALNFLGMYLTAQPERQSEAISAFRAALHNAPRYVDAHNNLGVALAKKTGGDSRGDRTL